MGTRDSPGGAFMVVGTSGSPGGAFMGTRDSPGGAFMVVGTSGSTGGAFVGTSVTASAPWGAMLGYKTCWGRPCAQNNKHGPSTTCGELMSWVQT